MSSERTTGRSVREGAEALPYDAKHAVQEDAADFFRRAVASERLAHAYLFLGPAGVGKSEFAKDLVKFLFCLEPKAKPTPGTLGGCGACRNCRRVDHGNLPDLHWFARKEGKRDIVMDDIDRLQKELSFKPVEGPWKVFVVEEADRLNASSANHMLKMLEEPPEYSIILLLAQEEEDVIPTILSRVHVMRFRPQAVKDLAGKLAREHGAGRDEAMFLARLSAGSPGLAIRLKEEGFYEKHRGFMERIRRMTPADNFEVAEELRKEVSENASTSQDERELMCQHLDGLMLAFRDEMEREAAGGDTGKLDRLRGAIEALVEASEAITLNANTRLVMENMMYRIAGCRR